ncbi:MAG: histidine phosphatase family protein [Candidatus Paracaedimonas acanthamoebae]|uniref:Histidine phosphatase family protein n=1 Tax=Candidatus Paracaedimonas acanthamoebae TaxID=244581 RepID=A0A8J7PK06_9PROT|nr:histidine phosphatase family protein [Candidatus Paracaedimonas acanthamoebae]
MNMKIFTVSVGLFFPNIICSTDSCLATSAIEEQGRDFLFIRHGQTPWGPDDILKGPQDLELDETGRHQAEGAFWTVKEHQDIHKPIIFSSHLKRAFETATIFANKLGEHVSIELVEGLQERYYGDYRDAPPENPRAYQPADAESTEAFQRRVQETLISIFKQTPKDEGDLIIVSHQKVFEFLAEWLSHEKLRLDQGAVCHFRFEDGKFSAEIYKSSSASVSSGFSSGAD